MKYLFKVEFTDGTTFKQSREDVSKIDPKRNDFYDVIQSKKKIKKYSIGRFLEKYSVDLTTGEFEINGTKIQVLDEPLPFIDGHLPELELIRDIQHKQKMNVTFALDTKKILSATPEADEVLYLIGWKTKVKGKKYQRVIGIK